MTQRQPSWETLNAYVDGELPASEAAEVARALAQDRALADQVASLTRLKAATQDTVGSLGGAVEITLPAPEDRRRWPLAVAASLVLAVAIGLAAASFGSWQGAQPPAWVVQARALHDSWVLAQDPEPRDVGSVVVVAQAKGAASGFLKAYLPDLSSARLTLTYLETVTLFQGGNLGKGAALHAGYRGTRGCKVSLLVLPSGAALPRRLTRRDDAALRAFAWRAGPLGYLLVAEGMDEERLALIAETVHLATLENSPFDTETRTALRESREHSQPCQA
jgi:anti-sigma factor RsiW